MNKIVKTKKEYFCKHCGNKISIYSALYGQSQCKQCQNREFFINKKELYNYYITKNKSIIEISKIYKCCYGTIYKWLLNYNIKIKNRRETHLGKKRPEHSKMMTGKSNPMYGKKRPLSVRLKISKGRIGKYSGKNHPMFGKIVNSKCSYGKGAYYKRIWMRSSWEIAYAKYLDKQNIKWLYEPKTFDLGNTTYTPDFYLPETDTYIEIKGRWLDNAFKKFKLFKKIYKNINIKILYGNYLKKEKIIC